MARGLRGDSGGSASLRQLIAEHKEAVEYDLIALGLRLDWLGTQALSWRDLLVIVRQAPRTSAVKRALLGDEAEWGLAEQLAAASHDLLAWLKWAQTDDGAKGRNHPEPLPRPGVTPPENRTQTGRDPVDLVDMAEWLAKRNPAQHKPHDGIEPHTEEAR